MSALLKIITDVDCDLYVDFEYKEHLTVGKMSKLEIQRGTYILDFKIDNVTIHSEDYYIPSNNEEYIYKFQFIENNKSRIILYDAGEKVFHGCLTLALRYNLPLVSPTRRVDIHEDAFDQPVVYHICTEQGKGMIVFKDSITSIGDRAFWGCTNLEKIVIPDGVVSIGRSAFSGCTKVAFYGKFATSDHNCIIVNDVLLACSPKDLNKYVVPDGIKVIGESAFYECKNLNTIELPSTINAIEKSAFEECKGLKYIVIPNEVKNIGESAFFNCCHLENIGLPDAISSLKDNLFKGCYNLNSIYIPESVKNIAESAFSGCSKVLFYGKYASEDHRCLIIDGLLHTFTSYGLESYTIPFGVETIRDYQFQSSSLRTIKVPESVKIIGSNAFCFTDNLIRIIMTSKTPPKLYGRIHFNHRGWISVPRESVDAYKHAEGWKYYARNICESLSVDRYI